MHINEFCKISNFLIRYKFKIKFLGTKIFGKICGEKISIYLFKPLTGRWRSRTNLTNPNPSLNLS
jgi:hypothetical protein